MTLDRIQRIDPDVIIMGNDMYWSKGDIPGYEALKETRILLNKALPHCKKTDVAIQAGGHCGRMVIEMKKHFKTIYTFEPNPTMFLCLCMNVPNPTVFKFNCCIGNEHKHVKMVKNGNWGDGGNFVQGEGDIPMLMVDDLNVRQCDLIQFDLEGYEYFALLGAEKTIDKFRPVLCLERGWGESHTGIPESMTTEFLDKYGYELIDKELWPDHVYRARD